MDNKAELKSRLIAMPRQPPPPPWRSVGVAVVGGLVAVGYADDRDLLLVISHEGRAVFDCWTGQRIARDREALTAFSDWYDATHLLARGIDPIDGVSVRVAGLDGGGLNRTTIDGWSLEIASPDWPDDFVFLEPPNESVYDAERAAGCTKLSDWDPVQAAGFSHTGRSLVIAQSHSLYMFARS